MAEGMNQDMDRRSFLRKAGSVVGGAAMTGLAAGAAAAQESPTNRELRERLQEQFKDVELDESEKTGNPQLDIIRKGQKKLEMDVKKMVDDFKRDTDKLLGKDKTE